jgi:hypothetical protein
LRALTREAILPVIGDALSNDRTGIGSPMRPLLFVNWHRLSSRFTVLMWLVACALAVVVLMHVPGGNASAAAAAHASRLGGSSNPVQLTRLRH